MDTWENANDIVSAIGKAIGLDDLALDETGVTSFVVEDEILCALYAEEEGLCIALFLGRVDPSNAELLYEMLCGNYLGAYTGGGTLAIDDEEGLAVIHRVFSLPIDEPTWIEEPLASLIGAARYWKGKMRDSSAEREATLTAGDHILRG